MAKKYYAVKKGAEIGIFNNWSECKLSVHNFPNAQYKSFNNYDDALSFITDDNPLNDDKNYDVEAYIDGSYNHDLKKFSYAGIIFHDNQRKEFAYSDDDPDLVSLRNVAGELKAAMFVMNYAITHSLKNIAIYYDYTGIENWAKQHWKTNTEFTKHYSQYAQEIMKKVNITFIKVEAHTGNQYNEEVDTLAKKALTENINIDLTTSDINNADESPLSRIKGFKQTLGLNILLDGKTITSEEIYSMFKIKWREMGHNLKDIAKIKSCFDVQNKCIIFEILTTNNDSVFISLDI